MDKKILVLGAYGNFGKLICENMAQREDISLILTGRSRQRADKFCESLKNGGSRSQLSSLATDTHSVSFLEILREIQPFIVINTCGPFQGQDYHVPTMCIDAGCHYVDLADDRRFVCDFQTLNDKAAHHNVIAICGASSVPGLSSAVIDHFAKEFERLDEIDFAIVPGSNVDMGEATLKGILSYAGQPFECWEQGKSNLRYGWMDTRRLYMGKILGTRWLANVDIPDLELFPIRYQGLQGVRFQAGHELGIVHLSMAFMALLSRHGWVRRWDRYSSIFFSLGQYVKRLGTDCGGMVIRISGNNGQGEQQQIIWRLIARAGAGPRIPAIPASILANRILDGVITSPGARPCLGMFHLDEFLKIAAKWGIYQEVERYG